MSVASPDNLVRGGSWVRARCDSRFVRHLRGALRRCVTPRTILAVNGSTRTSARGSRDTLERGRSTERARVTEHHGVALTTCQQKHHALARGGSARGRHCAGFASLTQIVSRPRNIQAYIQITRMWTATGQAGACRTLVRFEADMVPRSLRSIGQPKLKVIRTSACNSAGIFLGRPGPSSRLTPARPARSCPERNGALESPDCHS